MSAYKWTARLKEVVEAQEPQPHVEEEGGEGVYEDWGDARPVDEAGIPRLCPKVHEYSELAAQCAVEERVETLARIKADIPDADTLWKTLTDASFQMLSKLQAMNTSTSSQDDDGSNPRLPTYGSYRAAALRVAAKAGVPGEKFSISQYLAGEYVTPHLFYLSQRLPDTSSTPSLPIYTHITRKTVLQEMRIMLELCDSGGDGYLSEADFELFIHKIMPNLRTVKHVQQMMQGHYAVFYKCHAARKFFFFLDPSHRGRLSIDTILNSETLFELAKLFQIGNDDDQDGEDDELSVPEDLQTNWFTFQIMYRVYQHYVELDTEGDGNGMLCLEEMLGYNTHSFSPLFLQRIFEKYPTCGYATEIDYKRYLDFVLATEHTCTPQALSYFWNALDIGECGVLLRCHIDLFAKELSNKFASAGLPVIEPSDITHEIFDMVNPKHPEKITIEDIKNCGQMETVLSILVDYKAFHNYDCRESTYANAGKSSS